MKSLFLAMLFALHVSSHAAGYGAMGGFADGFQKGMANAQQQQAQEAALMQQRQAMRAQYGTKEIERLDFFASNAETRLYEIFKEFSTDEKR